jgi:alpha-beta hydrolase superfamily lysophospholipase
MATHHDPSWVVITHATWTGRRVLDDGGPMTVETLLQAEWNEPDGIAPRGTLVVVGGRAESAAVYQRFGRRIAADAYRVRFVDGDLTDLDDVARRIDAVLTDSQTTLPVVLVGSDTGGAVVLDYLAHRPELAQPDGAVLAGLTFPDDEVAAVDDEISIRTACPNHRNVLGREGVDHVLGTVSAHVPRPEPGSVSVPLLVVHGAADEIAPVDRVRQTVRGLAPRTELVTVDGGLHDALNDVTHRTVAATVVRFLERLKRGADLRPITVEEVL